MTHRHNAMQRGLLPVSIALALAPAFAGAQDAPATDPAEQATTLDRIVRISELAELTSFSSWYFSKTFLSLYDESPQAAAARLRIERAAELLESTSMMIGEVAAACGFDNCCSFARAFRARFGVSASNYRKGVRAGGFASPPDAANTPIADRKASLLTGT